MKRREDIHPPITRFERQTGNCPLLVAVIILDQLKNYFWTELPEDLADEVAQRAENVFECNARWRKKFQGHRGHEYLEMLLRHWLASALFKRKSPLFRRLPEDFKIGKPLPAVLSRASCRQSPKKFYRKRAISRSRKHFVHGCELLPV